VIVIGNYKKHEEPVAAQKPAVVEEVKRAAPA
jgi:hypothetical protein